MKTIKVPEDLFRPPHHHNSISLNDVNVIESCTHTRENKGRMFLNDHLILFVLEGTNVITYGTNKYKVGKNEMVLLKKNISVEYHKTGNPENGDNYDSIMFFLKDEFILDFIKISKIKQVESLEMAKVNVKPLTERLITFLASVKPYFYEQKVIDRGLIRLKMLELLYDLADSDKNLLLQLLQLKHPVVTDITSVVEDNFSSPISLEELAYLSGRSLSSFKRDFQKIYKVAPAQWIRKKKLDKAKNLLETTNWSIGEICYSCGFENFAHFSRLYKKEFGQPPSTFRALQEL